MAKIVKVDRRNVTFAQMLAISSPFDGQKVYVTDSTVKSEFTYDSTESTWYAPGFDVLTNNSGGALNAGDVVIQDTTTDDGIVTTTTEGDETVVGVIVVGGANGTTVLAKNAGEVDVNKIAGTANRGDHIYTSTTAGQVNFNSSSGTGDFGLVTEQSSGSTVRMKFKITETF